MSTVVGVIKGDELILAADSLTKYGDAKEPDELIKDFSKVVPFEDAVCQESALAFVGHASFGLVFRSSLSRLETPLNCSNRQAVYESFRRLYLDFKKSSYLVANDEDSFEGADVDCLVANSTGLYGVYSLQNVQEYKKYYAFGSGAAYALGALHASYEKTDCPRALAEKAMAASCSFDDASSGPFHFKSFKLQG